jgi:hypothetical protein
MVEQQRAHGFGSSRSVFAKRKGVQEALKV